MSPYLFLFCVEGFSALLKQEQQEKEIQGVSFGRTGLNVTHLLFADDSIVFLEASEVSLLELHSILNTYEQASGQKVNYQKSSIFFGKGCDEQMKATLKNSVGIDSEALNERYHGLPTLVGRSKDGCFKYVTERSAAKSCGWKGQGLSKAGREVLVKSVLQATPTFSMSCFRFAQKSAGT